MDLQNGLEAVDPSWRVEGNKYEHEDKDEGETRERASWRESERGLAA